jgi:hypothetical protein
LKSAERREVPVSSDATRIRVVTHEEKGKEWDGAFYAKVERWIASKRLFMRLVDDTYWNAIAGKDGQRNFKLEIREGAPTNKVSAEGHVTGIGGTVKLADIEDEVNRLYNDTKVKRLLRRIKRNVAGTGTLLRVADPPKASVR